MDLTDEQISKVLQKYKHKIEYDRNRYHTLKKVDPIFMEQNRARAKQHYYNNIERKKEYYKLNVDKKKLLNLYYYYSKRDKLDVLKIKHPDKYEELCNMGKIKDSEE